MDTYLPGVFPSSMQVSPAHYTAHAAKYGQPPASAWGNPFCNQPVASLSEENQIGVNETQLPPNIIVSNSEEQDLVTSSTTVDTVLNEYDTIFWTIKNESQDNVSNLLLKVLGGRSIEGRQLFISKFNADFSLDLFGIVQDLNPQDEKKLSYLFYTEQRINAMSLSIALESGVGTIDSAITEILFLSSNLQLLEYSGMYNEILNGRSLEDDISSATNGSVRDLCLAILERKRDENSFHSSTQSECIELKQTPKEERAGKMIEILSKRTRNYLTLFIEEFKDDDNRNIYEFVRYGIPKQPFDLFIPTLSDFLLMIAKKQRYFARQLIETLNCIATYGIGQAHGNNAELTRKLQTILRIFLLQFHLLPEIEKEYNSMSEQLLVNSIKTNIAIDIHFKNLFLIILASH